MWYCQELFFSIGFLQHLFHIFDPAYCFLARSYVFKYNRMAPDVPTDTVCNTERSSTLHSNPIVVSMSSVAMHYITTTRAVKYARSDTRPLHWLTFKMCQWIAPEQSPCKRMKHLQHVDRSNYIDNNT